MDEQFARYYANGELTKLYIKWAGMKNRCYNRRSSRYPLYGGRGIRVYDMWLGSFDNFAEWARKSGYREGLTLDRIDNDGNYTPDNCRWVTWDEQQRNRRFCHKGVFNGVAYSTLQEVADRVGISQNTLTKRLARGWPLELALSAPLGTRPRLGLRNHNTKPTIKDRKESHNVCDSSGRQEAVHEA